ncbi:sensor histidine kinase [Streptomyces sp. NA04227]|nr:sensor histidine kinase [Streptomyces sp. NA04227]
MGDVVLAVGLAIGGCVAGQQYHPPGWAEFDALAYALTLCTALPLLARRSAPATVLVLCCAGYATYLALGYQPSLNYWVPAIALVGLAAARPPRVSLPGAALTAAVVTQSGISGGLSPALVAVQALVVPLVALAFGLAQRRAAQRTAELRRLTRLLARQQAAEARRAITDERVRIARELHDVLAQHMSVISIQSGLASYVFTSDPPTARTAVETVARASHESLDELRRLLALLRTDPDSSDDSPNGTGTGSHDGGSPSLLPPHEPLPGIDRIPELAERTGLTGVRVRVHTEGIAPPLSPGLQLCVYRVVQEALTNVVKHSGAREAEVRVAHQPGRIAVTVRDDGRGEGTYGNGSYGKGDSGARRTAADGGGTGSGLGLIGMRERVKVWDGTLTTGQRPEGGFEVRLSLPVDGT